jgi:hypothetical protein
MLKKTHLNLHSVLPGLFESPRILQYIDNQPSHPL